MNDETDQQLLRAYAEQRSELAFAELVRRHVDFVYSAALRMVRDPHLAEDVTQGVFIALAKHAGQLTNHPQLSGWLHRTSQNIAAQTVRTNMRRCAREQEAVAMNKLLTSEPDATWENVAPHLDTALGELSEPDRDALLLRYFERKSAREMAQTLGTSEEAAQKRVNRAVERLRELFSKRNVTVGATGLVVLISTNGVQAAPVGLFATISTAVSLAGTVVQTSTTIAATKTIAMTTLQKTVAAAVVLLLVGAGGYKALHQSHSSSGPRTTAATQSIKGQLIGPGQLVDAGNTTPEAAWVSRYWARANGDYDAVIAATAPEAVDGAKAWMGDKASFRTGSKEEFASFKGLQILARKNLADDRVELKYQFAFQNIDSTRQETKIVEMVKMNGGWRSGGTRAYDASWDEGSQPEPQL